MWCLTLLALFMLHGNTKISKYCRCFPFVYLCIYLLLCSFLMGNLSSSSPYTGTQSLCGFALTVVLPSFFTKNKVFDLKVLQWRQWRERRDRKERVTLKIGRGRVKNLSINYKLMLVSWDRSVIVRKCMSIWHIENRQLMFKVLIAIK